MIQPIKRLGQNFLQDPNTIRKIVDSLTCRPDDRVVEIGPGMGALTGLLAEKYADFSAIELDDRAISYLNEQLPGVTVTQGDILEVNWEQIAAGSKSGSVSVIGNLPYYITSQIIFGLLDAREYVKEAVIMMQYEVAERLIAQPRTKQYGILSVAVQLACVPKLLFPVSRNVFFPKPDVRSAMVQLDFSSDRPDLGVDSDGLRRIIRTAFNQRRKTLRNSLSSVLAEKERELPEEFASKRAEELSPEDFVRLASYLLSD